MPRWTAVEALLGRLRPGVTTASIALKRARALLSLRQGSRDALPGSWALSALEDARTHPGLHPQGMLFGTALPLLPYLPDLLDSASLQALLDELAGGMADRIRRILACRDQAYILDSLWSNTIIVNFTLALADQGAVAMEARTSSTSSSSTGSPSTPACCASAAGGGRPTRRTPPSTGRIDRPPRGHYGRKRPRSCSGATVPGPLRPGGGKAAAGALPGRGDLPGRLPAGSPAAQIGHRLPPGAVLLDYYAYPANRSGQLSAWGTCGTRSLCAFRSGGWDPPPAPPALRGLSPGAAQPPVPDRRPVR